MIKDLLKQLPSSWEEITLQQFQNLTSTPIDDSSDMFAGVQNSLAVISKLTNTPVDKLEALPMKDLQSLANKLSFMQTPPEPAKKSIIAWKKLHEVTYNDYVSFIQLQEKQLENLHVFIKSFLKTELSEEEILKLPMTEIITGFFLFRKQLKKYYSGSIRFHQMKLVKQLAIRKMNQKLQDWGMKKRK